MPMIVNTAWLLEYLEPKCSHEDLLDAFPRLGLEIEQMHELRKELDSVRIGFVRRKAAGRRRARDITSARSSWNEAG